MDDPRRSRLTITEAVVFHSVDGGPPAVVTTAYDTLLGESDEHPYQRKFKVGPLWTRLDLGWVTGSGCRTLSLRNERERRLVYPSPEEIEAENRHIVELGIFCPDNKIVYPFAILRVGESLRFEPCGPSRLMIRTQEGEARCGLFAAPA